MAEQGNSDRQYPANGPAVINVTYPRVWQVMQPRVYRFMEKKYVDAFFEDGSLMLSSFERFAKHADEQRQDATEGTGSRIITGADCTLGMATSRGHDCYILCGSTLNTQAVRRCFPDADACLAIDNPADFANAISNSVPAYRMGISGLCIYQDALGIHRHDENLRFQDIEAKSLADMPRLMDLVGGVEELFVKSANFASQAEYRMVWASAAPIEEVIVVNCPGARQFCRPVEFRRDARKLAEAEGC